MPPSLELIVASAAASAFPLPKPPLLPRPPPPGSAPELPLLPPLAWLPPLLPVPGGPLPVAEVFPPLLLPAELLPAALPGSSGFAEQNGGRGCGLRHATGGDDPELQPAGRDPARKTPKSHTAR